MAGANGQFRASSHLCASVRASVLATVITSLLKTCFPCFQVTTFLVFSAFSFLSLLSGAVFHLTVECLRAQFLDLVPFLYMLSLGHLSHLLSFNLIYMLMSPKSLPWTTAGHPECSISRTELLIFLPKLLLRKRQLYPCSSSGSKPWGVLYFSYLALPSKISRILTDGQEAHEKLLNITNS